ncbi:MAG: metal ABC transporter substrate-binding protein [Lachnospiraceae bacterium]
MFRKKLLFLLGIMLVLSLAGYGVCHFAGENGKTELSAQTEQVRLVTSFYPMYVLTQNLILGAENTTVENLTENQTGCLHDYQLTAKDMKLLHGASALIINGADMELFVEQVLKAYPKLPVLTATQGITLLEGTAHSHNHEEEEQEHEEEEHTEASVHLHEENGHVWMDVERYRVQASVLCEELKELDALQSEAYTAAYLAYDKKLEELSEEISKLSDEAAGIPVVLFHEAFAYFADSLGMEVLAELALDEETVPSAGEIAEVIEEIRYHGTAFVFIEEAYASHARKIAEETDAVIVYLDPLVTGNGAADSYLSGMRKNLDAVRNALPAVR